MKKFFGKMPVMITFVALAVIFAVVYIGMLVRPVAIGMTYKGEVAGKEYTVTFKSGKKLELSTEGSEDAGKMYYFEKDGYVVFIPAENDEQFKQMKELALKDWEGTKLMVESGMGAKDCSAFNANVMGIEFKCTGSVVFAIVGGILELVLLAGAGLAVFYKVKK